MSTQVQKSTLPKATEIKTDDTEPIGTAILISLKQQYHPQLRCMSNVHLYKVKTANGWIQHQISTPSFLELPKKTIIKDFPRV